MHRVPTADADVLAYRSGGLGRILGAVTLAVLGGVLLKVITVWPHDRPVLTALLALAGIALILGGAVGLLRGLDRAGIVLDRARGQAIAWRRGVLIRSSERRELRTFWTVLLSTGRRQTRYAARTVYLVGLQGEVGEPLLLHWDADYQAARSFAEEVAAFLQFPWTDACATRPIVHSAEHLSRPLPATPAAASVAAPPPSRLQCRVA